VEETTRKEEREREKKKKKGEEMGDDECDTEDLEGEPELTPVAFSSIRLRTTTNAIKFVTEHPHVNIRNKRGAETELDFEPPTKKATTIVKEIDWDLVVQSTVSESPEKGESITTTSSSGDSYDSDSLSILEEEEERKRGPQILSITAPTPAEANKLAHLSDTDPIFQVRKKTANEASSIGAVSARSLETDKFIDLDEREEYEACFFCDYAEPHKDYVTHAGVKKLYSVLLRSRETTKLDHLCVTLYRIYQSEVYQPAVKQGLNPPKWSAHGIKMHLMDHMNDNETWTWRTLNEITDICKVLMGCAWYREEGTDRIVPDVKVIGLHQRYVKMQYDIRSHDTRKTTDSINELKNFVFGITEPDYYIKTKS
jgi:hypothetical protein